MSSRADRRSNSSRPRRGGGTTPAGAAPDDPADGRAPDARRLACAAVPAQALREDGISLYVHVPFCVAKCRYCDFNSHAWDGQDLERHVDLLLRELELRAAALRPQTVFIGGGTPSLLPAALIERLLAALHEITGFRDSAREATMEANPESCDAERLQAARAGGVTRLSIGAQSLRAEVLRAFDRVHGPEQALSAFHLARAHGFERVNLDLIFAWPGQRPEDWRQDLGRALELGPEHLSCYELSYEPGTALTRLRDAGRWRPQDQEACRELFEITAEVCARHGLGRYEVSAYARPGEACLHNLAYWRSLEWLGVGAGAASWQAGERRSNLARPEEYEAAVASGADPVAERERPAPHTLLFEILMMGLRLPEEGVCLERARRLTGLDPLRTLGATLEPLLADGLLELAGADDLRLRASARGFLVLDSLLERLLPAAPQ